MKNVTLRQLQKVTMGRLFHASGIMDVEISAIVSDSRKVRDDCLFICIKGSKVDGHDFAQAVIENGALAVVSEKELPGFEGPYLLVDSTFEATKAIAQYYREQLDVVFIGVTGSVGKTSTKEFIAEVLSKRYRVHKTQGNLNNEWGVPFTIFQIKDGIDVAVIEMGINHFGEMDRLAKMVQPDIVVMTNIGQSHLEFLGSRDGILKAKAEVFHYLSDDGKVILNGDDDKLSSIKSVKGIRPQLYGFDSQNDVCAENIVLHGIKGSSFDIVMRDHGGKLSMRIDLPVPGKQMIYNALAAYLVAVNMDLSPIQIKQALEQLSTGMAGRNNIVKTDRYTILDDCYNASPASVESAVDMLKLTDGRKVAILGDMLELGEDSEKYHYQVGKYVAEAGIDLIICVGPISEKMQLGAKLSTDNDVRHFLNVDDCIHSLPDLLHEGDNILVKASHSMNFSKIVDFLNS